MSVDEVVVKLDEFPDVKSVVISGGEPLLQQKQLVPLMMAIKERGYWIEVETNGTVRPIDKIFELVDQINCSPKLANSGDELSLRERSEALRAISSSDKATFKFVLSSDNDIEEILSYVQRYNMRQVYLMPEGRTKEELDRHTDFVQKLCRIHGFRFTQRLHIIKFGTKRGV